MLHNIRTVVYLQIAFRRERSATDGADKWFLPSVRALVDLKGAG